MAWPLDRGIRPYIRMAAYWLGRGMSDDEILRWTEFSRHYHSVADMASAIPEARRSMYFAQRLRDAGPDQTFGATWFGSMRGAWYAGYGRAPNAQERSWAYTRPAQMLGLAIQVTGRGERTNLPRRFEVTVNVPWNATMAQVRQYLIDQFAAGNMPSGLEEYDPVQLITAQFRIIGGALLEREATTYTM